MEISPNFAFLAKEFPNEAEAASQAEAYALSDPRGCLFHARRTLERTIQRVYKMDKTLVKPANPTLDNLLQEQCFKTGVPQKIWLKADFIRTTGNKAVHGTKEPSKADALLVVGELYHLLFWVGRTYLRKGAEQLEGQTYNPDVAKSAVTQPRTSQKEARAQQDELDQQRKDAAKREAEQDKTISDLKAINAAKEKEIEQIKAENAAVEDSHDYGEAETRERVIDENLRSAGWDPKARGCEEVPVTGMPEGKNGYVDYVLWDDDGKPLAVVEAKRTSKKVEEGRQQARLYADCLEKMHGQRPLIFYTNGYETNFWDDTMYPPRQVSGFYKKDELRRLMLRRTTRQPLETSAIDSEIAGRYYQKRAIKSICEQFEKNERKALLVMATGTGKTRTSIALIDLLQRASWAKNVLFLADRKSLVRQALKAFKAHLPSLVAVNLVEEKKEEGRVYASTYQTMMGLIDERDGSQLRFGPGHFDLIVIDEAHRSIYQKYRQIFSYFDSLLVGLTATPRDQVDRNTYSLFDLESGHPTDSYELEKAVQDGFLVPPKVTQVDLKFPREGIDYDSLSDEEKEAWENADWGDGPTPSHIPEKIEASALNKWLFNKSTVNLALKYLMENGHHVAGGERLGKTIIFARNHDHAEFIKKLFDERFKSTKGSFAEVIDHYQYSAEQLIEDFSKKDTDPHIAVSVDMLDTGIDVPEVVNLVFFKPVYSRIKFWQMIGRGTRLCENLFGPDQDKADFRIFDFCGNFDFFKENPDGIEGAATESISSRIFKNRLRLLEGVRAGETEQHDPEGTLCGSLADTLHRDVAAMDLDNFLVRAKRKAVERFAKREEWEQLEEPDVETLESDVAALPNTLDPEKTETLMFDFTSLRLQIAHLENDVTTFARLKTTVVTIASLLEEKTSIAKVKAQLKFLQALQNDEFWEGATLTMLEEMRLRLRDLVPLIDRAQRKVVYTDFTDEVQGVREGEAIEIPKMTSPQFEKRVRQFLKEHEDHIAVQKLKQNLPLTATDLYELEHKLQEIGEEDGPRLLKSLLEQNDTPDLALFIRSIVGMDRKAAQAAFSDFLATNNLTSKQTRFVEMIIVHLSARGAITTDSLYLSPFSDFDSDGLDGVFAGDEKVIGMLIASLEETVPKVVG